MAWGKVDDNLAFHPKVAQAGNEAMGLWVRSMSYCCQQLTDGMVPSVIVTAMDGQAAAERLVEVGLWHEVESGFEFNDWDEYQPSASEVRRKREELSRVRAEAGSRGGKTTANRQPKPQQTSSPEPEPEPEPDTTSLEVVLTRENPNEKFFELFWEVWPKRVGKADARRAWAKAVKKADPESIVSAATAYAASPYKPELQFIPMPATWLNGERWLDDQPQPSQVVTKAQGNLATVAHFQELERLAVEA